MNHPRGLLGLTLALFALTAPAFGQLPNPRLDQVFPPGGQVGEQVQVTVAGRDLDEGDRLLFSHPGITGTVKTKPPAEFQSEPQPVPNTFLVRIATNVPPGIYDVRVVGRFGASTARPFVVSTFPESIEQGAHHSPDDPAPLPLETIVNGRADAGNVDYFAFHADADRTLVVECAASEIASPLMPILTIWDADGNQLVRSHGPADPLVHVKIPTSGQYIVGVQDHIYRGGNDYIYRIIAHSGPYVVSAMPPSEQAGSVHPIELIGFGLGDTPQSPLTLHRAPLQTRTVDVFFPTRDGPTYDAVGPIETSLFDGFWYRYHTNRGTSNPVRLGFAMAPVRREAEDNDTPEQAQTIDIPCEYVGRFYPRRDQDWVAFSAKKGQQFRVQVLSHRLGLQTDPQLFVQKVVTDADGKSSSSQVSTSDDQKANADRFRRGLPRALDLSHRDPDVTFTADADATYRIGVRDLFGNSREDPRQIYRMVITEPHPNFRLLAWTERQAPDNDKKIQAAAPVVRPGGHATIFVDILRQNGFNQPITLTCEGLPPTVVCPTVTVPPGETEATLILTAAPDAPPWTGPVHVIGRATRAEESLTRIARAATLLSDTQDVQNSRPPGRLTNDLIVSVSADPAPLVLAPPRTVWQMAKGGKLEIPMELVANAPLKGELTLQPVGLPGDVKAQPVKFKADALKGTLVLDLNNGKIVPGRYTIRLRGKTKIAYARNPPALARLETERKVIDATVAQLAEAEKTLGEKAAQLTADIKGKTDQLAALAKLRQEVSDAVQQAHQATEQATIRLAQLQKLATTSGNDPAIGQAVEAAQSAAAGAGSQLETAQKSLVTVAEQLERSQQQLATLQKEAADAQLAQKTAAEKRQRAEAFRGQLDKQLADSRKNLGPKDLDAYFDLAPLTIEILAAPIHATLTPSTVEVTPGANATLSVSVERQFGFPGAAELAIQLPESAKGIAAQPVTLAADQSAVSLSIVAGDDATPGMYSGQVLVKTKFNDVESSVQLPVQVVVKKP